MDVDCVVRSVYRSPIRDLDSIGTPTSLYIHRSELPSFSASSTTSVHAENDRATTPSSPGITSSSFEISRGSLASTRGARGDAAAQKAAFALVASEASPECTSVGGVSSGVGMSPVPPGIPEAARADGAGQKAGSTIGDGGGDAEHLIDMSEVRDALLNLAVARGELVALAAHHQTRG